MTRTVRSAAIAALTALAAVAAIIAADFATPAQAQNDEITGRIVARLLDDGRIEFGWQPTSGARVLPRQRYFPTDATPNRWLRSSPVEVAGVEIGRINARQAQDGRIEFALTPTNGERIQPRGRYFPPDADVGKWLRSTEIAFGAPEGEAPALSAGFSLSAGRAHTCAVRQSGAVECWGHNDNGETGVPSGRFSSVSAGVLHTCGVRESGTVECWGYPARRLDAPSGRFSAVSAGGWHSCGLRESGTVECWGQAAPSSGRFSAVSAGSDHSCGVRDTGAVECWGDNDDGQADAPSGRFSAVSAGWRHSCGLREAGTVECWGNNEAGQADPPVRRFSAVSAGAYHSCGLREAGTVECWGYNEYGQADAPSGHFSAISAGAGHSCGLREAGTVECWGWNDDGQADAPSGRFRVAAVAVVGCPEPPQLFRVTATSPIAQRIVREERLDTACQVDGLPRGAVRPADRYAFTLDKPSRVSVELRSTAFPTHLFLTDGNGAYYYLDGTEAEGGRRLSLSGSRAADGDGDAIIGSHTGYLPNPGAPVSIPASLKRVRLEPGSYWLFAVSASGSRTGDYRLTVEYERIADSESLDQRIAERFAPVLLFEEGEQFFPVPVELMVRNSTLHYTQNGQERAKAPGTYGLADLISHNGQEAYLDLADADRDATGDRVVYARVAEIDGADNGVLVQYWFFYLYNETGDPIWSHEGDWEGVQMWFAGLDRDDLLTASVPKQLGYAAHESGWVVTRSITCLFADDPFRPNVYVARNRHASYPEPGSGGTLDKSFDRGDQFQGNGAVWTLPGRDAPDAEGELEQYEIRILPSGDQSWLAWDGKWGDKKTGSDGPSGPAFKSHFRNPPALNKGWSGSSGLPVFHCPSASE